jgi:hypothetical protein
MAFIGSIRDELASSMYIVQLLEQASTLDSGELEETR